MMAEASDRLRKIAIAAADMVSDGQVVGLGTGRAATAFIHALAERVRQGLSIRGVPTSIESAELAQQLGIPLTTLEEVGQLDIDVDGADEVDPAGNLIKGWGGALVRERIVAASADRLIIVVGTEKLVPVLGTRGRLPVEVVPFGLPLVSRRLEALGCPAEPRMQDGKLWLSDNGNAILDCRVTALEDPQQLEQQIINIPGVVGTGLFLGMTDTVLIQDGDEVVVRPVRTAAPA